MKPYGIDSLEEYPDVGDIKGNARKSSVGQIERKSGDFRGYEKNKEQKAVKRRAFKTGARQNAKKEIEDAIFEDKEYYDDLAAEAYNDIFDRY